MIVVRIFRAEGVNKSVELVEWERQEDVFIAAWTEFAKVASNALKEMFEKAVEITNFIMDAVTYEKPKHYKMNFTRSRVTHQTFDRKPRFAVRKILR